MSREIKEQKLEEARIVDVKHFNEVETGRDLDVKVVLKAVAPPLLTADCRAVVRFQGQEQVGEEKKLGDGDREIWSFTLGLPDSTGVYSFEVAAQEQNDLTGQWVDTDTQKEKVKVVPPGEAPTKTDRLIDRYGKPAVYGAAGGAVLATATDRKPVLFAAAGTLAGAAAVDIQEYLKTRGLSLPEKAAIGAAGLIAVPVAIKEA